MEKKRRIKWNVKKWRMNEEQYREKRKKYFKMTIKKFDKQQIEALEEWVNKQEK